MSLSDESFDSSAIARASYDPVAQVLFVFFKSELVTQRVWAYTGVPRSCFDSLAWAPSQGRYFREHIRGQFPYRQLFAADVELLLKRLAKSSDRVQISWVEQLVAAPAAQDTLALFF